MNSRPYLVITLALTTLVGAGLAWNQYRELVELRAAALNPDERAEWQKRAWDLEARNRELQDQLAALQARPADAGPRPEVAAAEPPPPDGPQRGGPRGGGRGQQFAAVRDLVNKPEVQALMRVQQTAAVDNRYAALFHTLNLDPAQTEKLKALLVERQSTLQDVMAAARDQGINPRNDPEAFRKLIADAQNDINASIRGVVGDNGLAQLQNYEQTLPQRTLVNEIQQRLSYTNTPLTPSQADQLVQILATTSPQRNNNNPVPGGDFPAGPPPGGGRGGFGGMAEVGGLIAGAVGGGPGAFGGGNSARVTAAAVTQAQAVLAPPQVAVLQQVQEQQQSQQKLQQILRETVTGGQNGTGAQPGGQGGGGQGRRKGGG